MKRVLLLLVLFVSISLSAQEPVAKDTITTTTSIENIVAVVKSGKTYELHTGSRGGRYIIRTSMKTGNKYKQYFNKEEVETLLALNTVNK